MTLNDYEIQHNSLVRGLAPECTLFLKSDGSFPLGKPCRVALFGSGARRTIRGGTGSGEVNSRESIDIESGLKEGGFEITTGKWLEEYTSLKDERRRAWIKAKKKEGKGIRAIANLMGAVMLEPDYDLPVNYDGDIAIYVLSRISGEGSDRTNERGDVRLTETEVRDIRLLNSKFDKFLLVLNVGGVVDLSEVMDTRNILLLSQLGALSGNILSDLLLGVSYPSGKLTTTWAGCEDYPSLDDFGDIDETLYREGIYVGYRFFDTMGKKPLFPFGFGLSYTRFDLALDKVELKGSLVCAKVKVTNKGGFKGREVVQLYLSSPFGRLGQPYQALAAFKKTRELDPGKSEVLSISFDMTNFASYDSSNEAYILEKGNYIIRIGNSSRDTFVAGVVDLDDEVTVRKARNVFGDCGFIDWLPDERKEETVPEKVAVLKMEASSIRTTETVYGREYEIDPLVKGLTDEELCHVNIGRYGKGLLSIIGNASKKVAGAAGDFTDALEGKGIRTITTADGPAGLRLSRKYFIDKGSVVSVGNDALAILADFIPGFVFKLINMLGKKPKKNQTVLEQYCTMIPIGTAVAQSFNVDLARAFGDMVGSEMERFKVDIWLAPALNIHRDIRCGRNFEYMSEDPLVSGAIAAALTEGVQSHPGRAVTIKHYAVNNQENNRYGSNSRVSERALREIYLKGFGIAVRDSQPKCVMTSYNLLNGTHTSEHKGLVEDVLRSEYGFGGVVMTDWIIGAMTGAGKYGPPSSCKIAMAGGDVMMPGSENDYNALLAGLKSGAVSRTQLEINATRMCRLILELSGK